MMSTLILISKTTGNSEISIEDLSIRRCRGCVGCLTDNRGKCSIDDDLTPILEEILANDTLKIISNKDGYRFTTSMHKVVERLSNILEAWTSSGNNIPESDDEITLREIIIVERSEDAEFEHSIREMLNKGPVSVYFEYE